MNTPAVTMVAAWISAETGVGPSIASGSQVCSRNCADLPIAPMNRSRQIERQRVGLPAEEVDGLAGERRRLREDGVEVDRAGHHEHGEDAEREAEIADTVDDERLDRRRVRLRLVIPEADQQIARKAHALPAEEELDEVVGRHQHQHREGEQRQVGEEARPVRVLFHVADGIEVHECRHGRDHHQHDGDQRIDADASSRPSDRPSASRRAALRASPGARSRRGRARSTTAPSRRTGTAW